MMLLRGLALALLPCAVQGPSHADFALATPLGDFDPAHADSTPSQVLQNQVYEGLVEYAYGADPIRFAPLLAESWENSADGLEWHFRLRADATFHDPGPDPWWPEHSRPLVAADVLHSWLHLADSRHSNPGWFALEGLVVGLDDFHARTGKDPATAEKAWKEACAQGLPGLQVLGPHRLLLRLTRPAGDLLMRLASPYLVILPREAWKEGARSLAQHPVGTGPFVLAEAIPRYRVVFHARTDWRSERDRYGPMPHIDELRFTSVPEPSTRTLLFEKGEIDRLPPVQDSFGKLIQNGRPAPELTARGVQMLRTETPDLSMLVFGMGDPVLGSVPGDEDGNRRRRLLRHAIALAFPYRGWQRIVRNDAWGRPARAFLPPGLPESTDIPSCLWRRHDPAAARHLLEEAGWPAGEGLPALHFELPGGDRASRDVGEMLRASLAEIGLRCEPVPNSMADYQRKVVSGRAQLFLWSWVLDWPDATNFYEVFYGPNAAPGINRGSFRDPIYDQLLERFRALPPGDTRTRLAGRLEARLGEEMPVVPIDHRRSFLLLQPWLRNVRVNAFALFACKHFVVEGRP